MRKDKMTIEWDIVANASDLPPKQQALLAAAKKALDKAYAPYSKFQVGAALQLENGEIISGANFENAAYPMCLCAERSAIATAVSTFPDVAATAIAITVKNPAHVISTPASPCGACRQVMVETEARQGKDMTVLMQGETGVIYVLESAKSLLPFYFDGSFLE
ncbi:MAG: cytidine deaminase [Bacteroidota bacterium]